MARIYFGITLIFMLNSFSVAISENREQCSVDLNDLREDISEIYEKLDMKLGWIISDGRPAPSNVSEILEVLNSLKEVESKLQRETGRKIIVRVDSEGCCGRREPSGISPLYDGPVFYINGRKASNLRGRGFNLMAISRATGQFIEARNFDTWTSDTDGVKMWDFVMNLPQDTIVVASVIDEASKKCREECREAIKEIGGKLFPRLGLGYRDGYALIGYKGSHCGSRPSWVKEERRRSSGITKAEWTRDRTRGGYGTKPITLITEINLDRCF